MRERGSQESKGREAGGPCKTFGTRGASGVLCEEGGPKLTYCRRITLAVSREQGHLGGDTRNAVAQPWVDAVVVVGVVGFRIYSEGRT